MSEPNPGATAPSSLPLSQRFPLQLELASLIDPEAFAEVRDPAGDRPGKAQRSNALAIARRLLDAGVGMPPWAVAAAAGTGGPEVASAIHSVRVAHRKAAERNAAADVVDEVQAAFIANLGILLGELDRLRGAGEVDL